MSEPSTPEETPAELRARAARYRKLEFPPDLRSAVLDVVAELEAMAAKMEAADQS